MADNTTTYKAVIETEVKGQKEIDDMNKSAEEGADKFKSLRAQIRETTVKLQELADQGKTGTKEFKELSNQLDDLGDAQKRVAFQSGQIEDKLAALPGPIGTIGKGFASAKESIDTFGKGLVIATGGVILIVEAFVKMYESLKETSKGQETLNRLTDATSKLIAPLMALIQTVAIPVFEGLAKVVSKVAEGVEWFAKKLGLTKTEIEEFNKSAKKANDEFYKQAETDLENMAKVQALIKQQKDEARRKEEEAHRKHLEKLAEQQRLADEKEKKDLEFQLAEIEKRKKKFGKIAEPVGPDGMTDSEREKAKKDQEARDKKYEERTKERREKLAKNAADRTIATWKTTSLAIEAQEKTSTDKRSKIDKWLTSEKKKNLDETLMATKAALNIAGNLVDEGSDAAKAIAVAQTGIDTYQSATAAYKAVVGIPVVGPALAPVAAAAAIAAGLMSVNKILSTDVPKMGDGSGGGSGAGASISAPSIPQMQAPDINISGGQNPSSQIAQTLAGATNKPIKAYVVSSDVSSQQALDRRTNRAATLSGGY